MTVYQEKLEARCQDARKWAPCLSSACDREWRGEPIWRMMMKSVIYRAACGVPGWSGTFDSLEQAIEFCKVDAFFKDNSKAMVEEITTEYSFVQNVPVESVSKAIVWESKLEKTDG